MSEGKEEFYVTLIVKPNDKFRGVNLFETGLEIGQVVGMGIGDAHHMEGMARDALEELAVLEDKAGECIDKLDEYTRKQLAAQRDWLDARK